MPSPSFAGRQEVTRWEREGLPSLVSALQKWTTAPRSAAVHLQLNVPNPTGEPTSTLIFRARKYCLEPCRCLCGVATKANLSVSTVKVIVLPPSTGKRRWLLAVSEGNLRILHTQV